MVPHYMIKYPNHRLLLVTHKSQATSSHHNLSNLSDDNFDMQNRDSHFRNLPEDEYPSSDFTSDSGAQPTHARMYVRNDVAGTSYNLPPLICDLIQSRSSH